MLTWYREGYVVSCSYLRARPLFLYTEYVFTVTICATVRKCAMSLVVGDMQEPNRRPSPDYLVLSWVRPLLAFSWHSMRVGLVPAWACPVFPRLPGIPCLSLQKECATPFVTLGANVSSPLGSGKL